MEANNMAAMLDALDVAVGMLESILEAFSTGTGGVYKSDVAEAIEKSNAALAKPPRNCDVGNAEEQKRRFKEYCDRHFDWIKQRGCEGCPARNYIAGWGVPYCQLKWDQMPYDEDAAFTKTGENVNSGGTIDMDGNKTKKGDVK